jgi:predicted dehydrogenase
VDLVGIADTAGDKHGVAQHTSLLSSVEDLISLGLDMAVIAVPTQYHEDVALELAAAGVHCLIEKPIAHTLKAGRRTIDAFTAAGLVGAVGHIERFNPALQELRRRLEAGALGDIYQVATRRQGPFPARIADVGVAKDLASHDVDLTSWAAQSDYETVFAQTLFKSGREHEDMIVITGRLASGIVVNHVVNWLTPFKERLAIVSGEKGTFVDDTFAGDLTFCANGTVALEWESLRAFRGVSEGDVIRFAFPKREPLKAEVTSL